MTSWLATRLPPAGPKIDSGTSRNWMTISDMRVGMRLPVRR